MTQLFAVGNRFSSVGPPNRIFVYGGIGTSFDSGTIATNQFAVGTQLRLGAYGAGSWSFDGRWRMYVGVGGMFR